MIDELRDIVKCLETETAENKNIIEDLQISENVKEKLIHRLRKQLFRPTHELLLRENYLLHWSNQEQVSLQKVVTSSEIKDKAKEIMTYIPPNRRSLGQA